MDETTQTYLGNLSSKDRVLQNTAYRHFLEITSRPVDWAYDVPDPL